MRVEEDVLINRWAGPAEWARAVNENRVGEWWERVVKYKLVFDMAGRPQFEVGRGTPLLDAEYEGMMAMRDLAMLGQKWVIWISPPGGMSKYKESRVVVAKVVDINGGVVMDCLGICGNHSQKEGLGMAEKLLNGGGVINGEVGKFDDLRSMPIGLGMGDEEALKLIQEVVVIEGVWQALADGRIDRNNRVVEEMVREAVADLPHVREMGDWMLQRHIEMRMAERGIRIMVGGNHGGSVLGGEAVGEFNGLFGRLQNIDSRLEQCSKCLNYYIKKKGECPKCSKGD